MEEQSVSPHILIEGRRGLTARLYDRRRKKPLVLSSRPVNRSVFRVGQFFPTYLIVGSEDGEFDPRDSFNDLLQETRTRFNLANSEPLRIVSVGSHGSLWHQECANAGGELGRSAANTLAQEEPGTYSNTNAVAQGGHLRSAAITYLRTSVHRRQFIGDLHRALLNWGGLRFHWLAEIVEKEFRPESPGCREAARFAQVAEIARRMLAEDPYLRTLDGAISMIFTRDALGWRLFDNGHIAQPNNHPSSVTRNLLAQYKREMKVRRRPDEAVLVKLLPSEPSRQNPCDNPMVNTYQLEVAKMLEIDAVLLDKERGVIVKEADHASSDTAPVYAF